MSPNVVSVLSTTSWSIVTFTKTTPRTQTTYRHSTTSTPTGCYNNNKRWAPALMVPSVIMTSTATSLPDALLLNCLTCVWMVTVGKGRQNVNRWMRVLSVEKVKNLVKMGYVEPVVLISMVVLWTPPYTVQVANVLLTGMNVLAMTSVPSINHTGLATTLALPLPSILPNS